MLVIDWSKKKDWSENIKELSLFKHFHSSQYNSKHDPKNENGIKDLAVLRHAKCLDFRDSRNVRIINAQHFPMSLPQKELSQQVSSFSICFYHAYVLLQHNQFWMVLFKLRVAF